VNQRPRTRAIPGFSTKSALPGRF